jgi:transposase
MGSTPKALCLKLDRFVEGNQEALALVRVPSEEEEQLRAIHRQREQLVKTRKRLEAQGRSLMVNHGIEPVQRWWKPRTFAALAVPAWMKELLNNSQPILLALEEKIRALTVKLQAAASPGQPRGLGLMTSVVMVRFQPEYKPVIKWRRVLAKGALATGAARKKAIVAVARQLAVDLWRIRTGRLNPEQLGLSI